MMEIYGSGKTFLKFFKSFLIFCFREHCLRVTLTRPEISQRQRGGRTMGQHNKNNKKRNQLNAKASRRRVLGAGTPAGAFLALAMARLANAPTAHAAVFDVVIDPIINSILGSITSLDALAGIDPSSALDLGSLAFPP